MRSRSLLLLIGAILAAVLAVGAALGYGFGYFDGASSLLGLGKLNQAAPEVGSPAPDFELASASGESIRLASFLGKPVLVNFWATWCAPCVLEMPNIQKVYDKYPGAFAVIAVNADESQVKVESFLKEMGLTFPAVLDPGSRVQALYRLRGYPTTYFIDSQGVVRFRHIGMLTESKLEEYLLELGVIQ
jgi:thiol-disulfide isomerase/thioredoxin